MNRITVNLDDLVHIVSQMKQDGVDQATIEIIENDDPLDDVSAFVCLSAPDPHDPTIEIEYDYIDSVC